MFSLPNVLKHFKLNDEDQTLQNIIIQDECTAIFRKIK